MSKVAEAEVQGRIEQLWVFPVKSCAGVSVPKAVLTEAGLYMDRAWMVVDSSGDFVTQRELPRMVLIQPQLTDHGCALHAPGMPLLELGMDQAGPSVSVSVWGDTLDAIDMGDAAAQWFTAFLGPEAPNDLKALRLVRFDPSVRRLCSKKWTGGREAITQFADGFGLLVTSTASLTDLNERLDKAGQGRVGIDRFRPNIVLGGIDAHDEDRIGPLTIATVDGLVVLESVKPCARCPIPNIDPATAESNPAVGDVLQTYRQDRRLAGAVTFGMNAIVIEGAGRCLAVGQAVGADWSFE